MLREVILNKKGMWDKAGDYGCLSNVEPRTRRAFGTKP